ncbi:hypothetical protein EYF80_043258 [Liparis tanakae]|uniref:Uncharacterized protein n=1 Tax=Liparis tanakae TaxID=230148 RepID=A0A4Z2FZ00_9TELE|nr:hypothetical protein EYF80_043258 [Liparis tanakae]
MFVSVSVNLQENKCVMSRCTRQRGLAPLLCLSGDLAALEQRVEGGGPEAGFVPQWIKRICGGSLAVEAESSTDQTVVAAPVVAAVAVKAGAVAGRRAQLAGRTAGDPGRAGFASGHPGQDHDRSMASPRHYGHCARDIADVMQELQEYSSDWVLWMRVSDLLTDTLLHGSFAQAEVKPSTPSKLGISPGTGEKVKRWRKDVKRTNSSILARIVLRVSSKPAENGRKASLLRNWPSESKKCSGLKVYVDVVPRVIGVPLLLVLHHFLFQESHDLLVVAEDGLVRPRQVLQQAGEGVIQLWMRTKP